MLSCLQNCDEIGGLSFVVLVTTSFICLFLFTFINVMQMVLTGLVPPIWPSTFVLICMPEVSLKYNL